MPAGNILDKEYSTDRTKTIASLKAHRSLKQNILNSMRSIIGQICVNCTDK